MHTRIDVVHRVPVCIEVLMQGGIGGRGREIRSVDRDPSRRSSGEAMQGDQEQGQEFGKHRMRSQTNPNRTRRTVETTGLTGVLSG